VLKTPYLALILALVPGVYAWVWGRRLIPHAGGPDLPELLLAARRRTNGAVLGTLVALIILTPSHALWGGAVTLVATAIGGFPARRKIFEETWGILPFLGFRLRFLLGFLGPWLLLLLTPLTFWQGDLWPALALAFPVVALASVFGGWILLMLLGATPLEDKDLLARFDAVLAKARSRRPTVYRTGPEGGKFVNGFAIPTPWAPAVLLSDDLLANLTPAEATAIFAHEVAHLEEFTLRRWLPRVLLPPALLVALMVPFAWHSADSMMGLLPVLWPLVCVLALLVSLARRRSDETASDLRAVDLTDDAESVISGLAKIHALSLQPRRLDRNIEARLSHPSLAKRVQAIRAHAGTAESGLDSTISPAAPEAALVVRGAAGDGRVAILHADRVEWLAGVPDEAPVEPEILRQVAARSRMVTYKELLELRIEANDPARRALLAVERDGKRKERLPLAPTAVAAVQAHLDRIDSLVGSGTAARRTVSRERKQQLPALLVLIAGLLPPFALALIVAGAVALVWPTPGILVGAGLIGMLNAAGNLARGNTGMWGMSPFYHAVFLLIQAGLGAWLVVLGVTARRGGHDAGHAAGSRGPLVFAGLAVVALGFGALFSLGNLPGMRLHLWLAHLPTALLLFLGAATALVLERRRRERRIGFAFVAIVVAQLGLASDWFRDRFSDDFFHAAPPALSARDATLQPIRVVAVDDIVGDVLLSPSGRRIAAQVYFYNEYDESSRMSYLVEWDDGMHPVDAGIVAWINDDALLVLTASDSGAILAAQTGDTETVWRLDLPRLRRPSLSVRDQRWTVWSFDSLGTLTEYRGAVGSSEYARATHRLPDQRTAIQSAVSDGLGGALLVASGLAQTSSLAYLPVFGGAALTSHLTLTSSAQPGAPRAMGATALMLTCVPALAGPAEFGCAATAGDRTELWLLDGEEPTPLGWLSGVGTVSGDGGGLVVHRVPSDELYLVDFSSGSAAHVPAAGLTSAEDSTAVASWIMSVAYRPGVLAVVRSRGNGGSRVDLYRVGALSRLVSTRE